MIMRPVTDDGAFVLPATQGMEVVVIDKDAMIEASNRACNIVKSIRHDMQYRVPLDDIAWIALEVVNDAFEDGEMDVHEHSLVSGAIDRIYLQGQ